MTFAKEVKQEISQNILLSCCQRAQLSAIILMSSKIVINSEGSSLKLQTTNSMTAKRIWQLSKDLFDVDVSLDVEEKQRFNKPNRYGVSINKDAFNVLKDLGLYDDGEFKELPPITTLNNECCRRAYLAGAFLASGSVNSPKNTNYHLEIVSDNLLHAEFVKHLCNEFHLNAKVVPRRNRYITYLKSAEKISDFLRAIGASHGVMEFENYRIHRDFRNSFTRLDNMELANEVKTIQAGQRQLLDIQLIEESGQFKNLEPIHQHVALLRKKFPEHSLNELCVEYENETGEVISKSGMNHRLKKISELAENIRKDK